jgi:exonuclease SbcD
MRKVIEKELPTRKDGKLDDDFEYVMLKVKINKVNNDEIKELEAVFNEKNAILCRIQKVIPTIDITTIAGSRPVTSIDDILKRNPLEALKETFFAKYACEMSPEQEQMLGEMLKSITSETEEV